MIWILLVLLTVIGGAAAVGIAWNEKRKSLGGGGPMRSLPAGGDKLLERTVRDLRVEDVLTIDGKDYVCEGLIMYDEDGHRWIGGRIFEGGKVAWLVIGIERAAASSTRILEQDDAATIAGYPSEAIVVGEVRYTLDKRGAATCQLYGDVGGLGALKKGRPEGHVERCRWWLYSAPGDDTLLVEQWGSDYRVLRGKKVADSMVELLPAS